MRHTPCRLLMPVYYIPDAITPEERAAAARAWNLILDDKAPQYLHNKVACMMYDAVYRACTRYV
ncbi:hypothetical protein EON63_02450 [archaeon]|nr:MAG: hypothetical protein EON63_02450 [archaeon]